jgi:hypothetical protein
MLGSARILHSRISADVFLDGQLSSGIYVFQQTERFDEDVVNWLILWIPLESNDREIVIVDIENEIVGLPNSSIYDYSLLFGQLIQSESGDMYVDITSSKAWPEHNPLLRISQHSLEFELPECDWLPCRSVKVTTYNKVLKGKTPST